MPAAPGTGHRSLATKRCGRKTEQNTTDNSRLRKPSQPGILYKWGDKKSRNEETKSGKGPYRGCACTKPRYGPFPLCSSRLREPSPAGGRVSSYGGWISSGNIQMYFCSVFPPGSLPHSPGALLRGWTRALHLVLKPSASFRIADELQDALNLHFLSWVHLCEAGITIRMH